MLQAPTPSRICRIHVSSKRRPPFLSGFVAPSCGLAGRSSSALVCSGPARLPVLARDSPMSQRSVHRIEEILPENVYTVEKRGPEIVKRVVHDAVEKDNADNAVPLSTLASLAERGT